MNCGNCLHLACSYSSCRRKKIHSIKSCQDWILCHCLQLVLKCWPNMQRQYDMFAAGCVLDSLTSSYNKIIGGLWIILQISGSSTILCLLWIINLKFNRENCETIFIPGSIWRINIESVTKRWLNYRKNKEEWWRIGAIDDK